MAEYQSPLNRLMDNLTGVASSLYEGESKKEESEKQRLWEAEERKKGRKLTRDEMAAANKRAKDELAQRAHEFGESYKLLKSESERQTVEHELKMEELRERLAQMEKAVNVQEARSLIFETRAKEFTEAGDVDVKPKELTPWQKITRSLGFQAGGYDVESALPEMATQPPSEIVDQIMPILQESGIDTKGIYPDLLNAAFETGPVLAGRAMDQYNKAIDKYLKETPLDKNRHIASSTVLGSLMGGLTPAAPFVWPQIYGINKWLDSLRKKARHKQITKATMGDLTSMERLWLEYFEEAGLPKFGQPTEFPQPQK